MCLKTSKGKSRLFAYLRFCAFYAFCAFSESKIFS